MLVLSDQLKINLRICFESTILSPLRKSGCLKFLLLCQWVYVGSCLLFWHSWYIWSLTIFLFPTFVRFFEALLSQVAGSQSSGSPIFLHCKFFGNMYCLTNWTKLYLYLFLFFHSYCLQWSILAFFCDLVSALLSRVDEAVFCMSLSLVALVGLFLSLRDVHCLFHLSNWLSLDWFHIDLNESGTCEKLTLKG